MRTMSVVVVDEFAEDHFELTSMEHQHRVQALASCSPDEPLSEHVHTRGPNGRADDSDAVGSEHLVEAGGQLVSRSRIRNLVG